MTFIFTYDQLPRMSENLIHEADRRKNLLFQKVGIFVDAENIEMSSLKHHDGRTDYKKLIDKVGDREILRILYYKPVYKEISQTFRDFWKRLGGEIKQPAKNADSFLIIDAVTLAEKLDVAIIVGGDKDYLPLVWYLKSRGCRVEIWSWPESTSPEVREAADVYFPLTKDFVIPMEASKEPMKEPVVPAASETPRSVAPAERLPPARQKPARTSSVDVAPAATGSEPGTGGAPAAPRSGGRRRGKRGGAKRRGRGGKGSSGAGGTSSPPPSDGGL
ncbi:MAG: NYN domain-containing protein [Bdellovibrionaceae bacterium]|nr:NYN domain-containing protein [Pseudobdellovibrionaceae bacterium]